MITQLERGPCWTVVDESGAPYHEDHTPHLDSAAQALASITGILDDHFRLNGDDGELDPPPNLTPQQEPANCWRVECDHCGYLYDEDDEGVYHMPPFTETAALMVDMNWIVDGDIAVCPTCACEVLGHHYPKPFTPCLCAGANWGRQHQHDVDATGACVMEHRYCWRCGEPERRLRGAA